MKFRHPTRERLGLLTSKTNERDNAIWLYVRFTLSFRDVEDLLAECGIVVSYETVRRWVNHFGPKIAADLFTIIRAEWDARKLRGTSKNRRFPPRCKSDSRFSCSERGRLEWDSLVFSI